MYLPYNPTNCSSKEYVSKREEIIHPHKKHVHKYSLPLHSQEPEAGDNLNVHQQVNRKIKIK
jgi:hypothetical protein